MCLHAVFSGRCQIRCCAEDSGKNTFSFHIPAFTAPTTLLLLAGCSDAVQPFSRPKGLSGGVPPPGENFNLAGPGAKREIDYKTPYEASGNEPLVYTCYESEHQSWVYREINRTNQ